MAFPAEPQRSIPAEIEQLTGITNDMVRDAPLFAEVADSFMGFMNDGIFVAHNVNFDCGFISRAPKERAAASARWVQQYVRRGDRHGGVAQA